VGYETLLPPLGFGLRTVQTVASRYFDYAVGLESRTVYVLSVKRMKYLTSWSRSCLKKVEIGQATVDSLCLPVWRFPPNRKVQIYLSAQQSSFPYFISETLERCWRSLEY